VAMWSKAWTVFAHSNVEIMGSNPTQGMDIVTCYATEYTLFELLVRLFTN
jgi:hypothetical protein